jgi:hypothetical protein
MTYLKRGLIVDKYTHSANSDYTTHFQFASNQMSHRRSWWIPAPVFLFRLGLRGVVDLSKIPAKICCGRNPVKQPVTDLEEVDATFVEKSLFFWTNLNQGCQMVYLHTKKSRFGFNLEGLVMWNFGIYNYGHLVCFMVIWYVLWSFGMFYGH